jgi:hypothetical protein
MWTWNFDPFGTDAADPNPAGAGALAYTLRFPGQVFDGRARLPLTLGEAVSTPAELPWPEIR